MVESVLRFLFGQRHTCQKEKCGHTYTLGQSTTGQKWGRFVAICPKCKNADKLRVGD